MMDRFLVFSSEVTAFTQFELKGTGLAPQYLTQVTSVIGESLLVELLDVYDRIASESQPAKDARLRREIFGDERLGPIARNIVKLWYVGIWYQLPRAWVDAYGALENDRTFMVGGSAYIEGLLWPAIGAHPPGAKAPGYASWVGPAVIPGL